MDADRTGAARVLVVDDEPQIRRALIRNLGAREFDVEAAPNGTAALRAAARQRPDVVILDLGLPDIDGMEVVRGLRGWTSVPIVILSVRDGENDKIAALEAGADDYVTKPFGMGELVARVRAVLRRVEPSAELPRLEDDGLVIDLASHHVSRDGLRVALTPIEWALVDVLARHRGKLVTHRQLLQAVWGPTYGTETNYLRVHFAHIRRKLERDPSRPRHFITEPRIGYRLQLGPGA